MKQALHPLVLFLFTSSFAQNLVPNPGFEDVLRIPSKQNNQVNCTRHWRSPTGGGTDYYHFEADHHAGTPGNVFGHQEPHGGEAYGGICIKDTYMEHLGVTLRDTLKEGQDYLVELYVSRADRSIGHVGEFGVLFIDRKIYSFAEEGISEKPSIVFSNSNDFNGKNKWTKLSGVYTAEGSEITLILGYFNHDPSKRCKTFSHYYIDDVSVTAVNEKEEEVVVAEKVKPEPVSETYSPAVGVPVVLKNIFFATNKSDLLPDSFRELDKLVKLLSNNKADIEIAGHTDNTGQEAQNLKLSEARAKAIADYLALKGIEEDRITYKGYGSDKPVADNGSEEGRQLNRRVEFVIAGE